MQIKNLKELQKLIQLCRRTGVESIELGQLKLTLSKSFMENELQNQTQPKRQKASPPSVQTSDAAGSLADDFNFDDLTDEQKLLWSAGLPETTNENN